MTARLLYRVASVCLHYPDDPKALALVGEALGALPARARDRVAPLVEYLAGTEGTRAKAEYVDLFDTKSGRTLYLTWYTDGDTRRRGSSLARLKGVYRAHGYTVDPEELPDYLPMLLEFAALTGDRDLLTSFRPCLVSLRDALGDNRYAGVVDAVLSTLPARRDTPAAPPDAERVGVEPVLLGYPTVRPAEVAR